MGKHFTPTSRISLTLLSKMNKNGCTTPTFSQAFRLFREKYNLHSRVNHQNGFYWYEIESYNFPYVTEWNTSNKLSLEEWEAYEEAELACLKKLIEIAIQGGNYEQL
mgnify:CR=1 FL=1